MAKWLFAIALLLPAVSPAQDGGDQESPDGEDPLYEEQDFPDLVRADETGGVMDEFALLADEMSDDEIESASKHRQSIFWSPSAVTVLTREEIQASGAADIADLLRRVPGMDVYHLKNAWPLVGARSLTDETNNQVLVLVDGREALAELSGFPFWNTLTFDLEEIERIEVIRGPGSALYGANAYAAVVSITTVPDRPVRAVDLYLSGGEEGRQRHFGRLRHHLGLGEGTLDFGVGLGMEKMHSPSDSSDQEEDFFRIHGYVRYREGQTLDLSLHSGFAHGDGMTFVHMGDMRFRQGTNFWILAKAELKTGETSRLKAQAYYMFHDAWFSYRARLRAFDIWIADVPDMRMTSPSTDLQVQYDWQILDELLFIAGGNLRYNTLDWENLVVSRDDEWRAAGFVHLQWSPLDSLQLTGGLRLDWNNITDPQLSPRVVAVYMPVWQHSFRVAFGLAFRRPSYLENRIHASLDNVNPATPEAVVLAETQVANEDLTDEMVRSLEAGWRARLLDDKLRLALDLFYNCYRNTIVFTVEIAERMGLPDMRNSVLQYRNEGAEVDTLGGELELSLHPSADWNLWANLGLRHATDIASGERMLNEPVLRANLGGEYRFPDYLRASLALHYVSTYQTPLWDPVNILNDRRMVELGDEFLLIARLGVLVKAGNAHGLEAGLTLTTPLGLPFREYAGTPIPPQHQIDSASDFGGELLYRRVSFYLRGWY